MRTSLSKAFKSLTHPASFDTYRTVPVFLCPVLVRSSASTNTSCLTLRFFETSTSALPSVLKFRASLSPTPPQHDVPAFKGAIPLPVSCPGCGALNQTVYPGEAGFYSATRKSVKAFIVQDDRPHTPEDRVLQSVTDNADHGLLRELGLDAMLNARSKSMFCTF